MLKEKEKYKKTAVFTENSRLLGVTIILDFILFIQSFVFKQKKNIINRKVFYTYVVFAYVVH